MSSKKVVDPYDGKVYKRIIPCKAHQNPGVEIKERCDMEKFICAYEDDSNEILKIFGDYVEIHADVDLQLEDCDYGVSGSPVWTEVFDYSIDRIYINEGSYTLKEFKAKYPEPVVKKVLCYIDDAVDEVELF